MNLTRQMIRILLAYSICTSLGTIEMKSQNINVSNKVGPMGLEVNTLTGNLFIARNDFNIRSRGFNIDVSFAYNSFDHDRISNFGTGWSFMYNIKYLNDSLAKRISWGDGREDKYEFLGNGSFKSPGGFFSILSEYQPNKFLVTEPDGTKYFFDDNTHKRITKIENLNGNSLSFGYIDTLLTTITNAAGQTITLAYANARLTSITDAISSPTRIFQYSYDGAGNLTQVTDPLNNTEKYTYLVNGPMKTITDKNGNTVNIIYYNDFTISELIGCNKRVSFSYDSTSLVTMATDHMSAGNTQVTKYSYKEREGKIWLAGLSGNCCGFNMSFEFDSDGNKIKEIDAKGNATTYSHDSRGNILSITDAFNQTEVFTYSADFNRITSYRDKKGFVTTMTYDSKGNLIQLTEPGNRSYTATYSANGDIISSIDPKGNTFNYSYDAFGNPASVTGPNGYTATLGYDARGNLLSFTDARGYTTSLEYDILNRIKKVTDPINNSVQVGYDAAGNLISVTGPNQETSVLGYDASNRLISATDAMGNERYVSYDEMNNIKSITNPLGHSLSYTYDNRNRLSVISDVSGNTATFSYDANGNISTINLPTGQSIQYSYDILNRLITASDLKGNLVNIEYDNNNNIVSATNGENSLTTADYDSVNRLKKITDALGNSSTLIYDKNNNLTSFTDRNGYTRTFTYDSLNQLRAYTNNNGFISSATYDAVGNLITAKDENNNITAYVYDSSNRITRTTYPDGKFTEYSYDKKGNVISNRLTDGSVINYNYDSLNRLIAKTLPDGHIFSYTYDAAGKVLTAANNSGTVTFTYDELGRIQSENFDGRTVNYDYNTAGRTQTITYPDNTVVVKSFDTRNRLTSIAKNNSLIVTYEYNNLNQVISKSFVNGVTTHYSYDFGNRLNGLSTANGNIQNSIFAYDKELNKISTSRLDNPILSEEFSYDNGNRLSNYKRGTIGGTPTVLNTYTYDDVGNRTNASLDGVNTFYSTNNLNQLTNSNNGSQNINFTYDDRGNLSYDGNYFKFYDHENRLIRDSSSPANVIHYIYDALGRRTQKVLNGNLFNYTYSGLAQIEERNGLTNSVLNRTVFSNFITPVVNERNNNSYYFHQNELNSVEALTDESGAIAERWRYDVYGKPSIFDASNNPLTGSITGNRFGFTGQEYDSATGTYRFFFRNYSPSTGTFYQRDPLGYDDGMGMYQYVHNNPANGVDIFGLKTLDKDPCAHDPNKIKYITEAEVERTKKEIIQYQLDYFQEFDFASNLNAIGSADSRYYTGMSTEQFGTGGGNERFYFKGGQLLNYEVNYYFTGYASGYRGFGGSFSQGTSRLWNGLKGAHELATGHGPGRLASAFNPFDTRATLAHSGNLDARHELGMDFLSGARDAFTGGSILDLGNVLLTDRGPDNSHPMSSRFDNQRTEFGEWWPMIDPKTGETAYEFFPFKNIPDSRMEEFLEYIKKHCPPQGPSNGTQRFRYRFPGQTASSHGIRSDDPNEIIGPDGVPDKAWVSVNDRLPYTVLFENSLSAGAPAKFVRIVAPVHEKMDASSFQLGSFGFNSLTFTVPPVTASYYTRLDCRDSLGLFVDITAGYDQINNRAFWEFQSIDPVTLLPPSDPFAGFLLLQDSTDITSGHGFVNFSIKPKPTAQTLDSIIAEAEIIFDANEMIPTNREKNTVDALPPTSHLNNLPGNTVGAINLSWSGADDLNGSGLHYYTLYVSNDGINFSIIRSGITRTDTSYTAAAGSMYYFFVLATDSVGNTESLRPGEIKSIFVGGAVLPVTWLYFKGKTENKDNILEWSVTNEQNSREYQVERSFNGVDFTRIGIVNAAGNSNSNSTYSYTDHNIHRLDQPVMYYRLKQVDQDNSFDYSSIVRLTYKEKELKKSIVYPNPTRGIINIMIGDKNLVGTTASVYDLAGKLLQQVKITSDNQSFDLSKYLAGVYYITLVNKEVLQVVKE